MKGGGRNQMNYQVNESGSHQRKLFLPDQVPSFRRSLLNPPAAQLGLNRVRMKGQESFTAQLETVQSPVTAGRGESPSLKFLFVEGIRQPISTND